jgi:hypothetical protein
MAARQHHGPAGGRRPQATPAAAHEASGVARDGASLALAPTSTYSVKNWIDISILVASVVILGRWMKGRKLRCDLLQLRY